MAGQRTTLSRSSRIFLQPHRAHPPRRRRGRREEPSLDCSTSKAESPGRVHQRQRRFRSSSRHSPSLIFPRPRCPHGAPDSRPGHHTARPADIQATTSPAPPFFVVLCTVWMRLVQRYQKKQAIQADHYLPSRHKLSEAQAVGTSFLSLFHLRLHQNLTTCTITHWFHLSGMGLASLHGNRSSLLPEVTKCRYPFHF